MNMVMRDIYLKMVKQKLSPDKVEDSCLDLMHHKHMLESIMRPFMLDEYGYNTINNDPGFKEKDKSILRFIMRYRI